MDPVHVPGYYDFYRHNSDYQSAVEKPPTAERSDAGMVTDVDETKDP